MPRVRVTLPHHSYDVLIEPGVLARLGEKVGEVAPHRRCALISEKQVFDLHGEAALASLRSAGFEVCLATPELGEERKTLATVARLYEPLLDAKLERGSPIVALGGGVTGDTVGFVAATYLRGVPFVQCPTTLLAMVDSSVGGKVGVNVPQGKNLIGAFYQPVRVVADPLALRTLPARELRCGLAECVKHALLGDAALFEWMESRVEALLALDAGALTELIERNVRIKANIVMQDEKEQGIRSHLNLGHTFGHAIEATSGYGVLLHGEAVALGLVAAARASELAGRCAAGLAERVRALLGRIGLPVRSRLAPLPQLLEAMTLDKKVKDGAVRLVLLDAAGAATVVRDVPADVVEQAWEEIRA